MSLNDLPDVALIRIFRTLDHFQLVRLYHSCQSSYRIRDLIESSAILWTDIRLQSTVDYHLFRYFARLIRINVEHVKSLIIEQLDSSCRKIFFDERISWKDFIQLEQIIIYDEMICQTLTSIPSEWRNLQILHLNNEHPNLEKLSSIFSLRSLQLIVNSIDLLNRSSWNCLTRLHLKIMFDYDQNARQIFSQLTTKSLQMFCLKFLLINPDASFPDYFHRYLQTMSHLHRLELSYLHVMCPFDNLHRILPIHQLNRLILINICPLKTSKRFFDFEQIDLPLEYFQWNSAVDVSSSSSSSSIHFERWGHQQLISIDYLQCVTNSMEIFNEFEPIWSDRFGVDQSFELYFLRSIYNFPNEICQIRKLSITRIELSLNGLVVLMTRLPLLNEMIISNGKIDQMGSTFVDLMKILRTTDENHQSLIQSITLNHLQMSRRTAVEFCLMTKTHLQCLKLDYVKFIDKSRLGQDNFLLFLKQFRQIYHRFQWENLRSLTLGQKMINRNNFNQFIPSTIEENSSFQVEHLHLIIDDHNVLIPSEIFLKSMKKLVQIYPKLTSLIVDLTKRYEGQFRLRNQLESLLRSTTTKKISVYPTPGDFACRFCLDVDLNDDDDDRSSINENSRRTFCGIPFGSRRKPFR